MLRQFCRSLNWGLASVLVALSFGGVIIAEEAPPTAPVAAPESLANQIDRLIAAKLPDFDKVAAPVCNDLEFLRRIHLDLTGSVPSSKQARDFLADTAPDKRAKLIDQLLA